MSTKESNQTEAKYQYIMGKTSSPVLLGETKGSVHVLQQAGGLLPAHLGPQALSLNTETVWGDISKTILKNKDMSKNLRRMTDLLLSLSNITKAVYPGFREGRKLLQMQPVQAHVRDLSDLEDMDERGTAKALGHMVGRIVCAAIKVGKFMRIERRERFMQDLSLDMKNVSAELVRNIIDSYDSAKDLPDRSAEFKRIVQPVSETNILCVMEAVGNFFMDHDLGWLLTVPESELSKGKNFFQNRWFAWLFIERVRKTSAFHTINGSFHNGVAIYKTALNTFLTADKRGTLVRRLEHLMQDLRLLRTTDIHSFFTTLMWYIRALNLLAPNSWAPHKVESETISLLKMSKATIGDRGNIQSALVSILSNIKNKDLDSIKNSLYSLYTDVKLQECAPNLPDGFFPNYTNVKEYGETLRDLKAGKTSSSVEKHASTNKKARHFNKGQNSKPSWEFCQ